MQGHCPGVSQGSAANWSSQPNVRGFALANPVFELGRATQKRRQSRSTSLVGDAREFALYCVGVRARPETFRARPSLISCNEAGCGTARQQSTAAILITNATDQRTTLGWQVAIVQM